MDSDTAQLARLLEMADIRLMRMLELVVFQPRVRLGFGSAVTVHRKELFLKLKRYLVVENNKEFIPRPLWQLKQLVGVGDAVLNHKHFLEGQHFVSKTFSAGSATVCLFLPCHRVKPYCFSPTVQSVKSVLESRNLSEHVAMAVASVPGIVPIGFDRYYPFAYYNWDPLKESSLTIRSYKEALQVRAREFIKNTKGNFSLYVAYFRPKSVELQALQLAARDEGTLIRVVPHARTVNGIIERNRALWRFAGLKRLECLSDLCNLLENHLSRRSSDVSTTN
jgi:Domain of unknown function (DUF5591)